MISESYLPAGIIHQYGKLGRLLSACLPSPTLLQNREGSDSWVKSTPVFPSLPPALFKPLFVAGCRWCCWQRTAPLWLLNAFQIAEPASLQARVYHIRGRGKGIFELCT